MSKEKTRERSQEAAGAAQAVRGTPEATVGGTSGTEAQGRSADSPGDGTRRAGQDPSRHSDGSVSLGAESPAPALRELEDPMRAEDANRNRGCRPARKGAAGPGSGKPGAGPGSWGRVGGQDAGRGGGSGGVAAC